MAAKITTPTLTLTTLLDAWATDETRDAHHLASYRQKLTLLIEGYADAMFYLGNSRTPDAAGEALRLKTERRDAITEALK